MEEKIDVKLLLITLFLGWFGIDKFYKGGRTAWKFFLVKFAYNIIAIGIIWNIVDLIMICRKTYQLDAREYFR